jgi:pimeloyl-ACP methyl ester carboxylesterase
MTFALGFFLATVRAIQNALPVFRPRLAPHHWFCTMGAILLRQIAFFDHLRHLSVCATKRLGFKALIVLTFFSLPARAETVEPFKDAEFAWPAIISGSWDSGFVTVDYNELRDINGRDEIPEKRAGKAYVDLSVRRAQEDLSIPTIVGDVKVIATGQSKAARFVVVYIHGQGGSRLQGAEDFTFGGNFNRLKNLVARAGGLYLSADFTDFGEKGVAEITSLIGRARGGAAPNAPVIVACASQGGAICNGLALSPVGGTLGGMLFLGASPDGRLLQSDAWLNRVPVYIGHGSRDPIFAIDKVEGFHKRLAANGYPAKMARFENGNHGTPIRMTDWRKVLNWMMAQ